MPRTTLCCALLILAPCVASAQGADSTPAQRDLRIIAELLPGHYSNANQVYFDARRGLPAKRRHAPREVIITRLAGDQDTLFTWAEAGQELRLQLLADPADPDHVVARLLPLFHEGNIGPAVREFRLARAAESFSGRSEDGHTLQVSRRELWLDDGAGSPFWLERSRRFHCYADIPGVGGGRNIPFDRYDGITLHDKGGEHWFESRDTAHRTLGLRLMAVNWHVLNEANGNFNRNSLVLYVSEKIEDGSVKEHGYAFTAPDADRIGLNLKWILVNCAITPRAEARPEL